MKKQYIIIACLVGLILLVIGVTILSRSPREVSTGGSGQLPAGSLVLTGYDELSNDNPGIPLGNFLAVYQQLNIRTYVEGILFEDNPQREYRGAIVPGSIDVDYITNDIKFIIEVENPSTSYAISINTVSDDMSVIDENGKIIPRVTNH